MTSVKIASSGDCDRWTPLFLCATASAKGSCPSGCRRGACCGRRPEPDPPANRALLAIQTTTLVSCVHVGGPPVDREPEPQDSRWPGLTRERPKTGAVSAARMRTADLGFRKDRLNKTEGVGFEPTVPQTGDNGFRDRPVQPLRHPSGRLILGGRPESGPRDAVGRPRQWQMPGGRAAGPSGGNERSAARRKK
jgi:hypothetical protein